jgi:DNA polymerase-3 subunit delta'
MNSAASRPTKARPRPEKKPGGAAKHTPEAATLQAERLPWHAHAWQRLADQRSAGRLPHALLLQGPAGVGKAAFGAFFAQAVLCAEPDASGAACGHCRSCVQFTAGSHPDFRVGEPPEDKKNILVDQVRGWIDWLVQRPHFQHGNKMLLIPAAERMNPAAANALLKTLEEPPADTLIVLVCARPASLLATVRSRCQAVVIAMPPPVQAMDWLQQRITALQLDAAEVGSTQDALALSGGAPLTALRVLVEQQVAPYQQLLQDFAAISAGRQDPVAVAASWKKPYSQAPEQILGWMLGSVQAMIRSKATGTGNDDANRDAGGQIQTRIRQLAGDQPETRLFEHLDRLVAALAQLHAGQNPNADLLLETLFIPWQPPATRRGRRV